MTESVAALLDTHSFLWFVAGNSRLSARARRVIETPQNQIFLSIASLWEVAIKAGSGKLELGQPFDQFVHTHVQGNRITVLGIETAHLITLSGLPLHHRDPFDRIIVAQAITENQTIVSVDPALDAYPATRFW